MSEVGPNHVSPNTQRPSESHAISHGDWACEDVTRLIELERAQIGHDLHDDLIPLLFVARASAERLCSDDLSVVEPMLHAESLRQIVRWLDDAMQCSRRLLGSTQSLEFVIANWKDSVAQQVSSLCGDAVEIVWEVDNESLSLPRELATAAYRIAVEATRNAVRHGKARRIVITATRTSTSTGSINQGQITIADDGGGFDPLAVGSDHFGLRIMRSRAQLAGGELTVHSQPGQPTTVVFTFSLAR